METTEKEHYKTGLEKRLGVAEIPSLRSRGGTAEPSFSFVWKQIDYPMIGGVFRVTESPEQYVLSYIDSFERETVILRLAFKSFEFGTRYTRLGDLDSSSRTTISKKLWRIKLKE